MKQKNQTKQNEITFISRALNSNVLNSQSENNHVFKVENNGTMMKTERKCLKMMAK